MQAEGKRLRRDFFGTSIQAGSTLGTVVASGPSLRDYNKVLSSTASLIGTQISCMRSAINRENKAKLKIVHISRARSFEHARALLEKWRRYSCSTSLRESHTQKWRFSLRSWRRKQVTYVV
ncbi:hypothetical protein CJ030_MR2G022056 [Morella rubra]|uniref:Uncharacterized protein n=1 Tax=Morella rubra TaxID=262757 RepID=A0A6A1WDX9_9ROSI|nr:hypothetical protein CJ030_MR2G022056 [Morella rubra]